MASRPPADTFESFALAFAIPFLSELKISWAFAAAPLHFKDRGWPLSTFGLTIGSSTLCRVAMNALLTAIGDWLIVPVLAAATAGAACMHGCMREAATP